MAKVGDKIKEGAAWVADKVLPKSTKEAVKDAARKASGVDDTIQKLRDEDNNAQADALQKATDEAYGKDASQIAKEAGGYNNAEQYGRDLGTKVLEEARPIDEQTKTGKFLEEENEEARKARDAAAAEEDAARKAAYQAAINTGANRAAASAIGSSVDTRGLQSNAASALRSAATSTQADYLNKMGYVEGLESNLENTKAASPGNIRSGVFQGAMEGFGTGTSIGGFLPF